MVRQLRRVLIFVFLVAVAWIVINAVVYRENASKTFSEVLRAVENKGEENVCYYDNSCAPPRILFRLQAETDQRPPFACLNDIRLFETAKLERGMNFAVLDGVSGDLVNTSKFDVTASDEKMMTWLMGLPEKSVLIAVSFGDMAERVSWHARRTFSLFGASSVQDWRAGSAYGLIGQRGIGVGSAIETVSKFSPLSNTAIESCSELPIGGSTNNSVASTLHFHRANEEKLKELGDLDSGPVHKSFVIGDFWKNCGQESACDKDSIAVSFFSGEHKDDHPKMCIDEKILFDRDLNDAGRGLNLATVDPKTGRVTAVANFDTYEDESRGLEQWLDAIPSGHIVAVVSFDEASNMLSEMAKKIFYEMGSSMSERLKFRASWYFVGYKGISSFTPFEDLNIPAGNNWAKPIKKSFCLPKLLSKWTGRVRVGVSTSQFSAAKNLPKRHFCAKYDRHEGFCDEENLDEVIIPRALSESQRDIKEDDAIFNVPILLVAGLAPDSLRLTLQSLMNQEGINTQMVLVAFDKEYPENSELASLFHVKSIAVSTNDSYNDMLLASLSVAFSVFPEAAAIAVIEEDVVLSPDWLNFFSNILSTLTVDPGLDLALAFNPNGYNDTSGRPEIVYRWPYQPPMYSYLLKKDFFDARIDRDPFCCAERNSWKLEKARSLVPALSRVAVSSDGFDSSQYLFGRPRLSSTNISTISHEFESELAYNQHVTHLIETAAFTVRLEELTCSKWKDFFEQNMDHKNSSIVVRHSERDLQKVAECFGLSLSEHMAKTHKSLRFGFKGEIDVFVVEA